ncbi:sulfotransferase family protein [Salinibacter ruber]|uniref:sulfotransferase family protein n=1 Tax=Salinibacter ruber TaxID=146919 RepID=UPI00216840AA|nr:hypothetical protein [Salinibacter ruber]
MIISQENEFIFIHIQRTAGTSIEKCLCNEMEVKNWQSFIGEPKEVALREPEEEFEEVYNTERRSKFEGMKHITARRMKNIVGENVWSSYYTFSFVRNPWDRILSAYLKRRKVSSNITKRLWPKSKFLFNLAVIVKYGLMSSKTKSQMDYITDERGNIIVDYVGRFESLQKDFEKVCSKIGIDADLGTNNDSTDHSHYREYYYDKTAELVRNHEFEKGNLLGYKF